MHKICRAFLLKKRPRGELTSDVFNLENVTVPKLETGQVVLKPRYFSVDPYMRNRMNNIPSYTPPFELDAPLEGDAIAEVVETSSDKLNKGDLVTGVMPWQEYCALPERRIQKIDIKIARETDYLSVLGLTGLTAYFGLLDIGRPKAGEAVVVSGAAGAVGIIAGQIARIKGCYVVGIAGGEQKVQYLKEKAGFDETIDYKAVAKIRRPLKSAVSEGVDIYFDNVGGEISDAVMLMLNDYARIVLCGQIALYNTGRLETGPRLLAQMIVHRVKMQGFIVYDYKEQYSRARQDLAAWLKQGKIIQPETIVEGFEQLPNALMSLFRGENLGKLIVSL
jgi:NADPH-dependent curcumin reductase CurA